MKVRTERKENALSRVRGVPNGLPLRLFRPVLYWKFDQGACGLEIPMPSWSEEGHLITPLLTSFLVIFCDYTVAAIEKYSLTSRAKWSGLFPYLLFTLSDPSQEPFLAHGQKNESPGHKRVKCRESLLSEGENKKERKKLSSVRGVSNRLPTFLFFHWVLAHTFFKWNLQGDHLPSWVLKRNSTSFPPEGYHLQPWNTNWVQWDSIDL